MSDLKKSFAYLPTLLIPIICLTMSAPQEIADEETSSQLLKQAELSSYHMAFLGKMPSRILNTSSSNGLLEQASHYDTSFIPYAVIIFVVVVAILGFKLFKRTQNTIQSLNDQLETKNNTIKNLMNRLNAKDEMPDDKLTQLQDELVKQESTIQSLNDQLETKNNTINELVEQRNNQGTQNKDDANYKSIANQLGQKALQIKNLTQAVQTKEHTIDDLERKIKKKDTEINALNKQIKHKRTNRKNILTRVIQERNSLGMKLEKHQRTQQQQQLLLTTLQQQLDTQKKKEKPYSDVIVARALTLVQGYWRSIHKDVLDDLVHEIHHFYIGQKPILQVTKFCINMNLKNDNLASVHKIIVSLYDPYQTQCTLMPITTTLSDGLPGNIYAELTKPGIYKLTTYRARYYLWIKSYHFDVNPVWEPFILAACTQQPMIAYNFLLPNMDILGEYASKSISIEVNGHVIPIYVIYYLSKKLQEKLAWEESQARDFCLQIDINLKSPYLDYQNWPLWQIQNAFGTGPIPLRQVAENEHLQETKSGKKFITIGQKEQIRHTTIQKF